MNQGKPTSNWIIGPASDLFYLSFGWVLLLAVFYVIGQTEWKNPLWHWLIIATLAINFLHRHITFPLVYADGDQFRQRKKAYTWLPLFFLLLTTGTVLYVQEPTVISEPLQAPVVMNKSDRLSLWVSTGQLKKKDLVRFKGTEATVADVVRTINEQTEGRIAVSALAGGRLKFTLKDPAFDRFLVGATRGSSGLRTRLGLSKVGRKWHKSSRPLFLGLVFLSVLWTLYHTIMQKIGLLRIYSRKSNVGKPLLDKAMVWSWFAYLFFQLAAIPSVLDRIYGLARTGKILTAILRPLLSVTPYIAMVLLMSALLITFYYLKEELSARSKFQWPKNLFMLSIILLYATFAYDFLVGYTLFGFSHAIEYLAFVCFFSKRKYILRERTSSTLARLAPEFSKAVTIFFLILLGIFALWRFGSAITLSWYIAGSSFLHFLYDGWIWKVRKPSVGEPLGVRYPSGAAA